MGALCDAPGRTDHSNLFLLTAAGRTNTYTLFPDRSRSVLPSFSLHIILAGLYHVGFEISDQ